MEYCIISNNFLLSKMAGEIQPFVAWTAGNSKWHKTSGTRKVKRERNRRWRPPAREGELQPPCNLPIFTYIIYCYIYYVWLAMRLYTMIINWHMLITLVCRVGIRWFSRVFQILQVLIYLKLKSNVYIFFKYFEKCESLRLNYASELAS